MVKLSYIFKMVALFPHFACTWVLGMLLITIDYFTFLDASTKSWVLVLRLDNTNFLAKTIFDSINEKKDIHGLKLEKPQLEKPMPKLIERSQRKLKLYRIGLKPIRAFFKTTRQQIGWPSTVLCRKSAYLLFEKIFKTRLLHTRCARSRYW